jgi:hypothetical protein
LWGRSHVHGVPVSSYVRVSGTRNKHTPSPRVFGVLFRQRIIQPSPPTPLTRPLCFILPSGLFPSFLLLGSVLVLRWSLAFGCTDSSQPPHPLSPTTLREPFTFGVGVRRVACVGSVSWVTGHFPGVLHVGVTPCLRRSLSLLDVGVFRLCFGIGCQVCLVK